MATPWTMALVTIIMLGSSSLVKSDNCYSVPNTLPFNPGSYDPSELTPTLCGVLCGQFVQNGFLFASTFQGTICLCYQSQSSATPGQCAFNCSGNSASSCGSNSSIYTNVYSSLFSTNNTLSTTSPVYANTVTTISHQICGTFQGNSKVIYNSQFPNRFTSNDFNLSSNCASNTLNYSYPAEDKVVVTGLLSVPEVGWKLETSTLVFVQQPYLYVSPVALGIVAVGVQYQTMFTVTSSYSNISISLGNNKTYNSNLLSSVPSTIGSLGGALGVLAPIDSNDVWLMPTLTITKNATLLDIRLRLIGSANVGLVYLQIYRPLCSPGSYYCFLQNACINTPNCGGNTNVRNVACGTNIYSIGYSSCLNASNQPVAQSTPNTLSFTGSYFLAYDIPISFSTLSQLTNNNGEYLKSFVSSGQAILLQPGDVPAIQQPDISGTVVATRSGSSVTKSTASIMNWNSRSGGTIATYPNVQLSGSTTTKSAIPAVFLSLARSYNFSIATSYNTHQCQGVLGCYAEDLRNLNVTVSNQLNTQAAIAQLHLRLNISGLNFTMPQICATFMNCMLSILPHYGSVPIYVIDFNDQQGNVTNLSGYLNQTSATHFYTTPNSYTVTVFASNDISAESMQQSVTVLDTVQGVHIYATSYPVGVIGVNTSFVLSVSQGSNATYVIDFGDGGSTTVTFDTTAISSQQPYSSFFIETLGCKFEDSILPFASSNFGTLENCAKACLSVASCMVFYFNPVSSTCKLYNSSIVLMPIYDAIPKNSSCSSTLYALKENCAEDILKSIPIMINATSGTTAIRMNESGWQASGGVNESLMIGFYSYVQLHTLQLQAAASNTWLSQFSIYTSPNSFTWTQYSQGALTTFTGPSSIGVASFLVLDPPIVTRYLKIQPISIQGGATAGARIALSGCIVSSKSQIVSHLYNSVATDTLLTQVQVKVNASNSVTNISTISYSYFLDIPTDNLTFTCLNCGLDIIMGQSLSFTLQGNWGNYLHVTIQRNDGINLFNATYYSSTSPLFFEIPFADVGVWKLTALVRNYITEVAVEASNTITVIQYPGYNCSDPLVDISQANGCSGSTCVTLSGVTALKVLRSSTWTVISNVSNFCPLKPYYYWTIQYKDPIQNFVDYSSNITSVYRNKYLTEPPSLNGSILVSLTFQPRTFVYGLYRINLTVVIPGASQSLNYSRWSVLYFFVMQSPLKACINSNSLTISSTLGQNVTLDGSCSTDPDMWPDEDQQLAYTWSCFRSCESPPVYDSSFNFVRWSASNQYRTNCTGDYSTTGCFSPFGVHQSGPIDPHVLADWLTVNSNNPMTYNSSLQTKNAEFISNKIWAYITSASNVSLVASTYAMFLNTSHYFILTAKKKTDYRASQTIAIVAFSAVSPPEVVIQCRANCYPVQYSSGPQAASIIIDPYAPLKLSSSIRNYDSLKTYTFRWMICLTNARGKGLVAYSSLLSVMQSGDCFNFISYNVSSFATTGTAQQGLSVDGGYPIFPKSFFGAVVAFVLSVTDTKNNLRTTSYLLGLVNQGPDVSILKVSASPERGVAFDTYFSITCSGERVNNTPASFSIGYSKYAPPSSNNYEDNLSYATNCNWLSAASRVCALNINSQLPSGNESNGNLLYLIIAVQDAVGSTNYFFSSLQVNRSALSYTSVLQTALNSTSLQNLVYSNQYQFIAYAYAVVDYINPSNNNSQGCSGNSCAPEQTSSTSSSTNAVVISNLVNKMSTLSEPITIPTLEQQAQLLNQLTKNVSQMLTNTTEYAFDLSAKLSNNFLTIVSSSTSININQLTNAASPVIQSLNNALNATNTAMTAYQNQNYSDVKTSSPFTEEQLRNYSAIYVSTVQNVAQTMLSSVVIDGPLEVFGDGSIGVQSVSLAALAKSQKKLTDVTCSSFNFGAVDNLFGTNTSNLPAYVNLLYTNFASNPYQYLPLSTQMQTTKIVKLMDTEFSTYEIANASGSNEFEIWIDSNLKSSDIPLLSSETTPYTTTFDENMLIHSIEVQTNSTLFVNVQHYLNYTATPQNSTLNGTARTEITYILSNNASYSDSNVMFIVYLQKDKYPTDTEYLANCTLPNLNPMELSCARQSQIDTSLNLSAIYQTLDGLTNLSYYDAMWKKTSGCSSFSNSYRNPWTCMFSNELLNNTNNGTYYFGVRAVQWNWTVPYVENGTVIDNSATSPVKTSSKKNLVYLKLDYQAISFYSGCFFYDPKTDNFSNAGCYVGGCSSPLATQCFCSHMTAFSNLFRLPQIKFDISALNINALNQSPAVMCFLISIICLYCIVWIWARYADAALEDKVGVIYIPENNVNDSFGYEITIWTGSTPGCGTSANVSIEIVGDESETEPRWLRNVETQQVFQRGSVNTFLLTNACWLGKLSHIKIWHDNKGSSPSWYLSRILIRDLNNNSKYYFISNSWLSAIHGAGDVSKVIPVAGKQDMRDYENVFWTRANNKVLDGHTWLSIVTRPARSRFTRVQRLTCCLVICNTTILFNLFGFIVKINAAEQLANQAEDPDPPIVVVGPITYTSYTLTVSVISALCCIPVNLLIITLFHERRLREPVKKPTDPYERYRTTPTFEPELAALRKSTNALPVTKQENDEDENNDANCIDKLRGIVGSCCGKIFPLPWWSHYVAYAIAFITLVACFLCTAILAYSNLPQEWMQLAWLKAIISSLLQSIIIVQPLQIMIIVLVFTLIIKKPYEDEDEVSPEIALSRPIVQIPESDYKNRYSNAFKPPPIPVITKSIRDRRKKEEEYESQLISAGFYVGFIILLYISAYFVISTNRYAVYKHANSRTQFSYMDNNGAPLNVEAVWSYIESRAMPYVYQFINTSVLNGNSEDVAIFPIGSQLRQLRIKNSTCNLPDMLHTVVPTCMGDYSDEINSYEPGWNALSSNASANIASDSLIWNLTAQAFLHSSGSNDPSYFAQLVASVLSSSGYFVKFSASENTNFELLENLKNFSWIDVRSKTVFYEYLLYSPYTNLFIVGKIKFDFQSTGITFMKSACSLWLNRYSGLNGSVYVLFDIVALLIITIFVTKTIVQVVSNPKHLTSCSLLFYDFIGSILCLLAVLTRIIYVIGSLYVESRISDQPQQFINLHLLCELNETSTFLISLVVFFADLRLLKLILFSPRIKSVFSSVMHVGSGIIAVSLVLVFIFVIFVQVFYFIYFDRCIKFATITDSLQSIIFVLTKNFDSNCMISYQSNVGIMFYVLYACAVIFIAMRLFIPILIQGAHHARLELRRNAHETDEGPLTYFKWKLKLFFGCEERNAEDEVFQYISGLQDCEELCRQAENKSENFSSLLLKSMELGKLQDDEILAKANETRSRKIVQV